MRLPGRIDRRSDEIFLISFAFAGGVLGRVRKVRRGERSGVPGFPRPGVPAMRAGIFRFRRRRHGFRRRGGACNGHILSGSGHRLAERNRAVPESEGAQLYPESYFLAGLVGQSRAGDSLVSRQPADRTRCERMRGTDGARLPGLGPAPSRCERMFVAGGARLRQ